MMFQGSNNTMTMTSPELLDRKYRILKELGRGAYGIIHLAEDELHNQVAIKCLDRSRIDAKALTRLQHEFSVLRSLTHANIAQPIDFGFDESTEQFFIVTEYICGATLDKVLLAASEQQALDLLHQALQALNYLHRQNIFHCDIKPANILVTSDGTLKVIDFDMATRGHNISGGTLYYAAPEIVASVQTTANAKIDLYALGATFYEGLTGRLAFPAKDLNELRQMHRNHSITPPSEIKPQLGTIWDNLLASLMHMNPSYRFSSASAVLQLLYPLLEKTPAPLSVSDITYRMKQHGRPIARDDLINEFEQVLKLDFRSSKNCLWFLQAPAGHGTTYILKEFKAQAQLAGINCYEWNLKRQEMPHFDAPLVFLIDDLTPMAMHSITASHKLKSILREFQYHEEDQNWMIIIGGMQNLDITETLIPNSLQQSSKVIHINNWSKSHVELWLKDIFQHDEIPDFVTQKFHDLSVGKPKVLSSLLPYYLEKNLLIDDRGHWRKDLFHPQPHFIEEFTPPSNHDVHLGLFQQLSATEQDLVYWLAFCYEALPYSWLANLKADNASALAQLRAKKIISFTNDDRCLLRDSTFNKAIENTLTKTEQQQRHDEHLRLYLLRSQTQEFQDEINHHKAHGSDKVLAIEGWNHFALSLARRGLWQSAFDAYNELLKLIPESEEARRFEFIVERDKLCINLKSPDDAKTIYLDLLKKYEFLKKQSPSATSRLHERLGVIETKRSNFSVAKKHFLDAIEALGETQSPLEQYLGLMNFIAGTELATGNTTEAIRIFRDTHKRAKNELPEDKRRILTNNDLAQALYQAGQIEEAFRHWDEVLLQYKNREDKIPLARASYQLAETFTKTGNILKAKECLETAMKEAKGTLDYDLELRIMNALANLYRDDQHTLALDYYEKALHAAFQTADTPTIAIVLINMGSLLCDNHNHARAKHSFIQALKYLTLTPQNKAQFFSLQHTVFLELARIELHQQKPQNALTHLAEAKRLIDNHTELSHKNFETQLLEWQTRLYANDKEKLLNAKLLLDQLADTPDRKNQIEQILSLYRSQPSSAEIKPEPVTETSKDEALGATVDFTVLHKQ